MGGILSLTSLACCFTSTACTAGCALCPSCKSSTGSRIMYGLLLLVTLVISCIMLAPGVQDILTKVRQLHIAKQWVKGIPCGVSLLIEMEEVYVQKLSIQVPFCEESPTLMSRLLEGVGKTGLTPVDVKIKCMDAVGYLAVYRICFIVTLFFLFMSVIMIGVRSSRDPRAGIQNGAWGLKYALVIVGWIGAFFIPHGSFGPTWMWFGMIGGFMFIIIQLVLIIDFAHSWAESWGEYHKQVRSLCSITTFVNNCFQSNDSSWFYALLAVTGFFYLLTLVVIILGYTYYTGSVVGQCKLHEFFITFNMLLCGVLTVTSVLPKVQEALPNSGLLQSSFVSLYMMYLTVSAMSNQPDPNCNLDLAAKVKSGSVPWSCLN